MSHDPFPEPRVYKGQLYRPLTTKPHTCRDGRETILAIWEAECATCGEPFTSSTPLHSPKFQPSRRCKIHKQPGRDAGCLA
jgi:hypothetical protein